MNEYHGETKVMFWVNVIRTLFSAIVIIWLCSFFYDYFGENVNQTFEVQDGYDN